MAGRIAIRRSPNYWKSEIETMESQTVTPYQAAVFEEFLDWLLDSLEPYINQNTTEESKNEN